MEPCPLSCFEDAESPTCQVEEVNCMLPTSTCWLEPEGWWCWLPITSPTNQKNVHGWSHTQQPPPLTLFLKTFVWKTVGSSGLLSTSHQDFLFGTSNKCYTFLHHNTVSVVWLYLTWVSGHTFGSVAKIILICEDMSCDRQFKFNTNLFFEQII